MNKWVNRKLEKKRTTGKGFTLIELIVVVTVLGILAAIVIYAVGNFQSAATKAASGTTTSEVNQAEQAYCQANGQYGNLQQLVTGGYLTNPDPSLSVYTYTIPANAQLFGGCGTSVYDAYPQVVIQPDGTQANIPVPPTSIMTTDNGIPVEVLAALGITPIGAFSPATSITPLINNTSINTIGAGAFKPNLQAMSAAHPQLLVGINGVLGLGQAMISSYEAIAPLLVLNSFVPPTNPQAGDISLLWWAPELITLANLTNTQVQAAAFLTTFENEAATIEPSLAGKSVSVLLPVGTNLSFQGIADDNNYVTELLEYMGMNVICPGNCTANTAQTYNLPIASASSTTITAQYLLVGADSAGVATGLFGTPGTQAGPALANTQGGTLGAVLPASTIVFGPNSQWVFGAGSSGTLAMSPSTLTSPLTSYCSTAGVAYPTQVANAPATLNGLLVTPNPTMCPPWSASTTGGVTTFTSPTGTQSTTAPASYSAVTLSGGIEPTGPITMLAALPYLTTAFPNASTVH